MQQIETDLKYACSEDINQSSYIHCFSGSAPDNTVDTLYQEK